MSDTLITIIAIFLAAILMFIFPLMTMADRNDDVNQMIVQSETNELVDGVVNTGKLTQDQYNNFVSTLAATGNAYDVEIQIQILDENPSKKGSDSNNVVVIGENIYYCVYTTQVEERLNSEDEYVLKEGDIITITVKNRGVTLAQTLRNVFYGVSGSDTYTTYATDSGTITTDGK